MEYLGSPRLDVPMAELTEVSLGAGGRKSPVNLNVPQEQHQQRRSVTGYDASYEGKSNSILFFILPSGREHWNTLNISATTASQ